jgi:hypothetical protein
MFDVGEKIDAIGFGLAEKVPGLGSFVDVMGSLVIDTFWGSPRLQLKVVDIAPADNISLEESSIS